MSLLRKSSMLRPLMAFLVTYLVLIFQCHKVMTESEHSSSSSCSSNPGSIKMELLGISPHITQLHVIILQHGIMGNPMEMEYVKQALETEAKLFAKLHDDQHEQEQLMYTNWQVLVYSTKSNTGKTFDGIAAGGSRLAEEVNELLQQIERERDREQLPGTNENEQANKEEDNAPAITTVDKLDISFSLLGHSLGGLYARAALKDMELLSKYYKNFTITPKIFCTTVTPHLGVHQHTWIPIPRRLEMVVGHSMKQTGRDLFRLNDLMDELITGPHYLEPLQAFESRIAVANAFGTDFQVPTASAAFLADTDSKHHVIEKDEDHAWLTLEVQTPKQPLTPIQGKGPLSEAVHATRLDALGWRKLFIDMREHLWSLPNCKTSNLEDNTKEATQQVWQSSELKISLGKFECHFPWGHSLMVANQKNSLYRWMHDAGKPVMDHLAQELLVEILGMPRPIRQETATIGKDTEGTAVTVAETTETGETQAANPEVAETGETETEAETKTAEAEQQTRNL